ncbi:MAG TPA: tetratricopeptide repeat protein, partial [Chloroflexota bacterium]|nr:tetratricopeptide repeat protein [Chloroflexota bacterium]
RIEATAGALPLLAGGPSDAPARHQTLRAAIAWSYDLLTPQEQTLLRRLSVFAGGFGLSAAEAVGGDGIEGEGGAVVEALEGLVTKSLLRRDEREGAPRQGAPAGTGWLPPGWSAPAEDPPAPRFQMLETVREFAALRLEESGEADAVRERHTACFAPLAARTQTYDARWLNDVEREHDNLRAAMRWCLARGGPSFARQGLRFGAALAHFWVFRGHLSQGQKELAWALSRPAPADPGRAYHWARATLLTKAGHLARRRGDFPTARRLYEAGLALRRETGQLAMLPFSLRSLGGLALDQGDFPTARACHGEALALRREAGCPNLCETLLDVGRLAQEDGDGDGARRLLQEGLDLARANALPHAIATGHDELGRLAWLVGDQRWARTHHEAALAVARELGDKGQTAAALDHLGRVALSLEDGPTAARRHGAALTLAWEFGDQLRVASCLEGLAGVAAAQGQGRRAARLLGAAAARRDALGAPLPPSRRPWHLRHLERARASLSDEDFGGAWRAGQAMPLERVVAFALAI